MAPNERLQLESTPQRVFTEADRVLWLADPATRIVTEYRPGQEPREYRDGDTVTVDDLIPGFSMPIEEVFRF